MSMCHPSPARLVGWKLGRARVIECRRLRTSAGKEVAFERLGTRREKEWIVLAPHSQQARLVGAEIRLESWVERDIALVITEQVELQLIGAGPGQIKVIEGVAVGRNQGRVGYAVRVLPVSCLRREEGAERCSVRLRRVLPIGTDRSPALAETFLVRVAVLRDDGRDPLGVADGKPEARGRAVVKNIKREAIEADDFRKPLDDAGDVVERVAEFIAWRHVRLTEAGKVGRDHVKSVSKKRDQVPKHMARAREAV